MPEEARAPIRRLTLAMHLNQSFRSSARASPANCAGRRDRTAQPARPATPLLAEIDLSYGRAVGHLVLHVHAVVLPRGERTQPEPLPAVPSTNTIILPRRSIYRACLARPDVHPLVTHQR